MFKNKVILFYTKEELEEVCKKFPKIFKKDFYFSFYFSGGYSFPMIVWDIEKDFLFHQGLKDIDKWDSEYIELVRKSIDWKDFIQEIEKGDNNV